MKKVITAICLILIFLTSSTLFAEKILEYNFDRGDDGWSFQKDYGSVIGCAGNGNLEIQYSNELSASYWRKVPNLEPVFSWGKDTLYVLEMDVTSSVDPADPDFEVGDIPDIRFWIGDEASDAMASRWIDSYISDGGSCYISPVKKGISYKWIVSPSVMPETVHKGMIHFEGFNPKKTEEKIGMDAIRLYELSGFDANEEGVEIGRIEGIDMVEEGDAWEWIYVDVGSSDTLSSFVENSENGSLSLTYPENADPAKLYWGEWVTNPYASPTQNIAFEAKKLYRARFNFSTNQANYDFYQNHIPVECTVWTKDGHIRSSAGRYSNHGTTVRLNSEGMNVDVWFYYEGDQRDSIWDYQFMFSFKGYAHSGHMVTPGNTVYLNSIVVTEHGELPNYKEE